MSFVSMLPLPQTVGQWWNSVTKQVHISLVFLPHAFFCCKEFPHPQDATLYFIVVSPKQLLTVIVVSVQVLNTLSGCWAFHSLSPHNPHNNGNYALLLNFSNRIRSDFKVLICQSPTVGN